MKHNKRIVIIGSAGVGKTTLFNSLKRRLGLKPINEIARDLCIRLGYKNIYEIKDQEKFRFLVLEEQIKLEEKYKEFISDRSTIDCWVHWVRWSWNKVETDRWGIYESEKYYELSRNQALKYSHIIYIPRLFKGKEDGFRWNDESYQKQLNRLFKETLFEWDLMKRVYIINSKDVNERVRDGIKFISWS